MAYPNRRPLLISAILVALTSIPTMIVVAAGTASLHQRDRSQVPALAHPDHGPVIVGPGGASALRERPRSAAVSVEVVVRSSGRVVISSGTARRPEAALSVPPPATVPPPLEHDCPSPSATPEEPRMDDRAWPGWDRRWTEPS